MKIEGMWDLDNPNPDGTLNLTQSGQEILDANRYYRDYYKSIGDIEAYNHQNEIIDIIQSI